MRPRSAPSPPGSCLVPRRAPSWEALRSPGISQRRRQRQEGERTADACAPWVGEPLAWEESSPAIEAGSRSSSASNSPVLGCRGASSRALEGRSTFAQSDALAPDARIRRHSPHVAGAAARARACSPIRARARSDGSTPRVGLAILARQSSVERRARRRAARGDVASGVIPRALGRFASNRLEDGIAIRRVALHHGAHSAERHPPSLSGSPRGLASAVRSISAHMNSEGYAGPAATTASSIPTVASSKGASSAWHGGAHAGGTNNVQNIGVCLLGNFDREQPTTRRRSARSSTCWTSFAPSGTSPPRGARALRLRRPRIARARTCTAGCVPTPEPSRSEPLT